MIVIAHSNITTSLSVIAFITLDLILSIIFILFFPLSFHRYSETIFYFPIIASLLTFISFPLDTKFRRVLSTASCNALHSLDMAEYEVRHKIIKAVSYFEVNHKILKTCKEFEHYVSNLSVSI